MRNAKKIFSDKAFLIQLIGFVFLQIFIDMYKPFFESSIQIFGISLPELINLLYLAFLTLVFFVKAIKKPKVLIPFGIYSLLLVVYLVFHLLNISRFDQSILNNSEQNWFKEIYFILRTYLIPVFVFYYLLHSDLDRTFFKKTLSAVSLIISSNIIITNVFKVSFICYASTLEKNSFVTRNVFEWFFNPDTKNPVYMTSKGWFYMGNQIGFILLMLFVFVIMFALESGKVSDYLIAFSNALAMILVGTKVATLGCCIVLLLGIVFAIVFGLILKQFSFRLKHIIIYGVMAIVCLGIIPFSPTGIIQAQKEEAFIITEEQQNITETLKKEEAELKGEGEGKDKNSKVNKANLERFKKNFCAYLNSAPYFFGVEPEFLELFPAEENFDFWYRIATGGNEQVNYRQFKSSLYEEILRLNKNEIGDRLFGIGYVSAFPYSEQDFVSQNIWFGFFGTVLFIGPYFLMLCWGIILALKKIKTCFIYQNAFFALFIGLSTLLCLMAGHLFYGIFSITIFAFVTAYFFKYQTERVRSL